MVFVVVMGAWSATVQADHSGAFAGVHHPLPEGFTMFVTLMGTGLYDWTSPHPEVPNCFQQLCIGDYFFDEILGFDDAAKQAFHADALAHWQSRFGIDPTDPVWDGRVMAVPFLADPRVNMRAYSMAGFRIPPAGWTVHDGGWILIVIDPDGIELGGEFAGMYVPANTVFSRGKYVIETRPRTGAWQADVVIDYQARAPIPFVPGAPAMGNCEVLGATVGGEDLGWGPGHGQPSQLIVPMPSGEIKTSYRNVVTFGIGSGLGAPYPAEGGIRD